MQPSSQTPRWPALHLYPVNGLFTPRVLRLANNRHEKIQPTNNTGVVVNRFNGNISAYVLSSPHADIWEENGKVCFAIAVLRIHEVDWLTYKIFMRDLASTHGTTLTQSGSEVDIVLDSKPCQLRDNDIIVR